MHSPGITVRPIITIDLHHVDEVFFDNVRVPKANLVGETDKGWTMAKALLGFERIFHRRRLKPVVLRARGG